MIGKFLITGLPRSRTMWMAEFFKCPHEPSAQFQSKEDIINFYEGDDGCSDSGLGFWLDYIIDKINPKILIIGRPIEDVNKSLLKLNIDIPRTDYCELLLERLNEFRDHPSVMSVSFDSLNNLDVLRNIHKHLRPNEYLDQERFLRLGQERIEVDLKDIKISKPSIYDEIGTLLRVLD